MKFIELFAGVGGFRYALESNGGGFECVYANEWDKYAAAVYRYHWNDGTMHEADIRTVDPDGLPEHDLICGGFPCQSFSIAGKRRGFSDTRGTLFFEIMRIARACRSKYLFLENVKGLLNHKGGATFQTIITTLDELGYDCEWQVLNSKAYVPQNRERVFIIGHLRGERRFQVFPIGEGNGADNELQGGPITGAITARRGNAQSDGDYIIESQRQAQTGITRKGLTDIANAIDANYTKGQSKNGQCERTMIFLGGIMGDKNKMWLEDGKDNSRNFPQGQRVYSPEGISAQLTAQGGGWGAKTGLYEIPETAQALQTDGQLRTGSSWNTNIPQSQRSIRRLTPIECERLQAFPDNWTKYGLFNGVIKEISDTQRYKMMGNAVTTAVITDIKSRILGG